jgi:hypothetical protein
LSLASEHRCETTRQIEMVVAAEASAGSERVWRESCCAIPESKRRCGTEREESITGTTAETRTRTRPRPRRGFTPRRNQSDGDVGRAGTLESLAVRGEHESWHGD